MMNISTRLAVGIHILTLLEASKEARHTSQWIAQSVGTNPVVIRRITGMLRKAGLVETLPGTAGLALAKPASDITLLEIYKAVDAVEEGSLFGVHEHPSPDCPVGRNIAGALVPIFGRAQAAMEGVLGEVTLEQLAGPFRTG